MARLRAARFHRLQLFLEAKRQNPGLKFLSWLRVVAKRVGIDYLRTHPEYIRAEVAWVTPGTLPPSSQLGDRPPVTSRGTAHELLAYAEGALPEEQRRALEMWAGSASWSDIARELALPDEPSAERLVRAAIERLRRRFRT
jgi:DNA-directed RNA polymerase specialized sigma24 family protein